MIERNTVNNIKHQIDLYVNGRLSEQEVEELWTELVQNEDYMDYMKTAANVKAIVEEERAQKQQRYYRYWAYAAAAVIALVIGVMTVLNYPSQQKLGVKPLQKIELEYYRSADGSISPSTRNDIIQQAIELANNGNTQGAIDLLKNQMSQTNDPVSIASLSLNIGSLYYNSDDFNQAVTYFRKVVNQPKVGVLTLEKGYWFLGNTYFQMGQLDNARKAIRNAYDLNGAYRRVAKSYLDALSEN